MGAVQSPFAAGVTAGLTAPTGATPAAGVALINGTQTIVQWTAPADGNQHYLELAVSKDVTSAETGGACQCHWTVPGGAAATTNPYAGGQGTGGQSPAGATSFVIASGTTWALQQSSALTVGASTVNAAFWAV